MVEYLPTAENILASSTPAAQSVFSHFMQFGWLEIGAIIGALVILFIIGVFTGAFAKFIALFHKNPADKWE